MYHPSITSSIAENEFCRMVGASFSNAELCTSNEIPCTCFDRRMRGEESWGTQLPTCASPP
jgi:hypothetical protein